MPPELQIDRPPRRLKDVMWSFAVRPLIYQRYTDIATVPTSPASGTSQLGGGNIPNVIAAIGPDEEQAHELDEFDRVVWSLGIPRDPAQGDYLDRLHVMDELAANHPNIEGVMLDDFSKIIRHRRTTPQYLADIRYAIQSRPHPYSLWGVVYTHNFPGIPQHIYGYEGQIWPLSDYLPLFDVISCWHWVAEDLTELERNFEQLEEMAGGKPISLGLYMHNFGGSDPTGKHPRGKLLPVELMQHQCELALKWAQQKRIVGMQFLGSTLLDMDLEAVNWTKDWIADVADEEIPAV